MSDIKFECKFCGGLSEDLSQDSRLPEQFRHGVYDVQEVLEDDIVQIHGWFHDGTNKFKVIYDPEGDLTIELGNGECLLKVMERNTQEVRDYFAGASPEKGLDPLWAMLKDLIAGMGDGAGTEGYLLLLWGDVQEPSLRALAAERNRLVLKAIEARLPAGPRPPEHTAGLIQTVIQGSCMQWLVEPEGELAAFMTKRTHMLLSVLYPDHVFG